MAIFQMQKRTTFKAVALKQIKEAIKSGKLKPGDRVVEARLAKEMGISRFPIREAISYLEKEGVLVTIPFRGTYVSQFDENDLEELYTLRSALEELAIRILMEKITSEKIKKLESILAAMEQATRKGKVGRLIFGDMQFHQAICELSGHRRLLDIWLTSKDQLRSFIALEEHSYEGPAQLLKTHYPLMEAIKQGDSALAEKCIRDHLNDAFQIVKKAHRKRTEDKPD
jgi:DNA-binding GntR family transcriptional regulator